MSPPTFNLWADPWLTAEGLTGGNLQLGLERVLVRAHEVRTLYDPSPLVVVGAHRLLTAILQDIFNPRLPTELRALWAQGQLPPERVAAFGVQYTHRFDLFSEKMPFLQSADLPLVPEKGTQKTVAYLTPEIPAGTAITHYRHGCEDNQILCSSCAAAGLLMIPPFATSGGAGIKPSVNGVPPLYVLPGGDSLFESLTRSLVLPDYQPQVASRAQDEVWWRREPLVERGAEIAQVGYLHSLTFPARRVRLHPEAMTGPCTRCGRRSPWGVRTMVFEMGESRPKASAFWADPFAAYRLPDPKKGGDAPIPIRPTAGKAMWREFGSLFLRETRQRGGPQTQRPAVLDQLAEWSLDLAAESTIPFRCVGLRTDMKSKIFEWVDTGFGVPVALLEDDAGATVVEEALRFATEAAGIIAYAFREAFGGRVKKQEHHRTLKSRLMDEYWATLAAPFRLLLLGAATDTRMEARQRWINTVVHEGGQAFARAAEGLGDDSVTLRQRVQGEEQCRIRLYTKRKEHLS